MWCVLHAFIQIYGYSMNSTFLYQTGNNTFNKIVFYYKIIKSKISHKNNILNEYCGREDVHNVEKFLVHLYGIREILYV